MMTHPHALLSAYLDGILDTEETSLVEEHLELCLDCRKDLADLRHLASVLAKAPRRSMPPAFQEKLHRNISRLEGWRGVFHRHPRLLPVGAMAAAGLVMGIVWWGLSDAPQEPAALRLEPLMAAHLLSASEGPVPTSNYYASDFSAQLASYQEPSD
jgi:anti-sigma factor RsiW